MQNYTTNGIFPFPPNTFLSSTTSLDSNGRCEIPIQSLLQIVLSAEYFQSRRNSDAVLTEGNVLGSSLVSGPDFLTSGLFLLVVLFNHLAHSALEVERAHLHLGVKQAVNENTSVDVLLGVNAEVLVLRHDSFVHVANGVEVLIVRVLVAIDFISHHRLGWADRSKPLHEEEVRTNVEGCIGPEVGGGDSEALLDLILTCGTEMLDMAVLDLDMVGVEVGNCGDVGVRDPAVVAFVIVVGQNLPIKVALHIPGMIKDVILEVVVLEPGLLINTVKVVLPSNLGGPLCVQVHPDETISVNMSMDRVEVVVVEGTNASFAVFGDDEFIANDIILNIVTRVGDSVLVSSKEPFAGENRPSFKLEHVLGRVPGSGKSTDGFLLVFRVFRRSSGGTKEVPQEGHCNYEANIRSNKEQRRDIELLVWTCELRML